jgi:O-antigen/teichoic acid export membrane protein
MAVSRHVTRLARHSAVYGLGDLVARFVGVLLLPLYTAYLSPSDYGKIEILAAASAVALVLLRRGVSDGFFRFWFDLFQEDPGLS